MKFTINTSEFAKVLLNNSRIVPSSPINPIYEKIKLDLDDMGLVLTTSNNSLNMQTTVPFFKDNQEIIRDYSSGSTLLSAKLLSEIVKRSDGEEVTFEIIDSSQARIEGDRTTYNTPVMRAIEYPDIDFTLSGVKVEIDAQDLLNAINEVSFAASLKNTRNALTAVNLECTSSLLIFTATDGARLARKEIPTDTKEVFNINIPAKTLQEVARTLETEKNIELYVSDKKISFKFHDTIITSSLVTDPYPNVKSIIPKNFNYFLEVNSSDFLKALDNVAFIANERERTAKLTMIEGKVTVSSKSQKGGNANDTLSLFRFQGDRFEISFNIDYVSQAIRALKAEDILLSFIGEMKPFTVTNKADPSVVQLITPVRTF